MEGPTPIATEPVMALVVVCCLAFLGVAAFATWVLVKLFLKWMRS